MSSRVLFHKGSVKKETLLDGWSSALPRHPSYAALRGGQTSRAACSRFGVALADICRLPLEGIKSICYCMLTPNSQSCGRVKCVLSRIGIAGNLRTNLDQAFSPTMLFSSVMTESSCKPHSLPRRIRGPCVGEYIISRNRLGPAHLQHA